MCVLRYPDHRSSCWCCKVKRFVEICITSRYLFGYCIFLCRASSARVMLIFANVWPCDTNVTITVRGQNGLLTRSSYYYFDKFVSILPSTLIYYLLAILVTWPNLTCSFIAQLCNYCSLSRLRLLDSVILTVWIERCFAVVVYFTNLSVASNNLTSTVLDSIIFCRVNDNDEQFIHTQHKVCTVSWR